ncbi:MAG: alpha-amylase [Methanomicrobiales archaeon]|nr:alpha-amylase [Methanomicrobiales archaeon]
MSRVCIGFEVHQPYRISHEFDPIRSRQNRDLKSIYFTGRNREIFERIQEKCYVPATSLILELLDQDFRCAFSLSGTVVEQMKEWGEESLELFRQVARHRNAELLGQTYYHSLAGLFKDKREFMEQVRLHRTMMKETFGVTPSIVENTEFIFDNSIAWAAKQLGFKGMYAEGVDRILEWRSPNYIYTCEGIPILLRNYRLSDDLAFRFSCRDWSEYPLTADRFASWIAASPGDCIQLFIDYETFGEHHWKESGILEFLRWLPEELVQKGNECILPSHAVEIEPRGELDFSETTSWADVEKDTSAWLGNCKQETAFNAVETAAHLAGDRTIWRYLQTSDHFYYMATKHGSCGEVHSYFSQCAPFESFASYMRVLSDLEERAAKVKRSKGAAMALRCLPPEKAFHFFSPYGYMGYSAYSLDEFAKLLEVVPVDSITHHCERGDFERWLSEVVEDPVLAGRVKGCRERHVLVEQVNKRRAALWRRLK